MAPLPKITVAIAGMATSNPTVATTFISGERKRRCRKRTVYSTIPMRGPAMPTETIAAVGIDQFCSVWR